MYPANRKLNVYSRLSDTDRCEIRSCHVSQASGSNLIRRSGIRSNTLGFSSMIKIANTLGLSSGLATLNSGITQSQRPISDIVLVNSSIAASGFGSSVSNLPSLFDITCSVCRLASNGIGQCLFQSVLYAENRKTLRRGSGQFGFKGSLGVGDAILNLDRRARFSESASRIWIALTVSRATSPARMGLAVQSSSRRSVCTISVKRDRKRRFGDLDLLNGRRGTSITLAQDESLGLVVRSRKVNKQEGGKSIWRSWSRELS